MLLNYMNYINSKWNRTSIRLSDTEYRTLQIIAKKKKVSPTSYIELQRGMYNKDREGSTNFTAYLRDSMFKYLIGEVK